MPKSRGTALFCTIGSSKCDISTKEVSVECTSYVVLVYYKNKYISEHV